MPDLRCPRCGSNLVADTLLEADLCCLMCSRRYNLVEGRVRDAQSAFLSFHGGGNPRPRRRRA